MDNKKLNAAIELHQNGDVTQAIDLYSSLMIENKEDAQLLFLMGVAHLQINKLEISQEYLKKSIAIYPQNPSSYYNLGLVYQDLENFEGAVKEYRRAIQLEPDYAEAYFNLGVSLSYLRRLNEALESFDRAISINPNDPEIHSNRGIIFKELRRFEEALECYNRALKLDSNMAEVYSYRGAVNKSLKRYKDALIDIREALKLKPDMKYILSSFIQCKSKICDWSDYDKDLNKLINHIKEFKKSALPFDILALTADPSLQKKSAEIFTLDKYPKIRISHETEKFYEHNKIRIGYFSSDFHNHATMHLIADLFDYHNKDEFELYAFSFDSSASDEWRERVKVNFKEFIDVTNKSEKEIALISKELEIDIAIDLKGYTEDARPSIFAYRAAPIQVNYLGYPGTMGSRDIDYIIADVHVIPENNKQYFTEKIVYLPNTYQANVTKRNISKKDFTREEMGLPNNAFIFCSFNNNWKITPEIFSSWISILKAVKGSVLWLLADNIYAIENLKKEAVKRGVDSNRLIFASFMPIEEHLKRIQLADLFLDTFPYNAHTTASDSLRMGLPLITRSGNSFASRVAASLLNAIDLPELITTTKEEFELLAIDLANNHDRLLQIKNRLLNNLSVTPLFNSKLFTQHLETTYKTIYKRYLDDLPPDHIYISN